MDKQLNEQRNEQQALILVVDDNPTNIKVLFDVLERANFRVLVAKNGESTLEKLKVVTPDLILLDVMMPGIDGFEVCRKLKRTHTLRDIPIIFMTALADETSKVEGLSLGAVDYVTKPLHQAEVLSRIRIHLKLRRVSQQLEQQNERLKQELELRQRIENQLRQSEQRYRSLYEKTPIMLDSIDPEGNLLNVSNYWLTKTGYERHEVLGKKFSEFLTEDSKRYAAEVVLPAYFQTGSCWDIPYQWVCKNGTIIDVLLSAVAERDETGQIVRSLAVMVDVTERNRAQAGLVQSEKMATLGRLIAGIAHELRNPLNFVKNYAEGSVELNQDLLDTLKPVLPELEPAIAEELQALMADLQENATTICHHSQRAEQVIVSMMQHTHTDYGRTAPQPTPLSELLDRAVKLVSHSKQAPESNCLPSVHKDYAVDLEPINVVPGSLIRAFINLIDNAYDAMHLKRRQLKINGTDYTPTLWLSTRNLGGQVEIRIRDNGCGIDPALQSKILDPFFTTKPPGEGTGLGLSLTHDIITKQHQGTVTLDTKPGEFTEFLVVLPTR